MLCRICVSDPTDIIGFKNIFENHKILTLISKYLNFKPKVEETFSNQICSDCLTVLENFDNFFTKIQDAQKALEKIIIANSNKNQPNVKVELIGGIKESEKTKIEIVDPIEIKIERESTTILLADQQGTEIERFYSEELSEPKSEEDVMKDDNDSPTSDSDDPELSSASSNEERKKLTYAERRRLRRRQRRLVNSTLKLHKRDEKILNFMKKLNCPLCEKEFKCWDDLRKHSIAEHKVKRPFVKCCDKKFFQRPHLIDHIDVHSNPNKNTCELCGRLYPSYKLLYDHKKKTHEQTTPLKCDICLKMFKNEKILSTHKETHIPIEKRQLKCTDCDKCFASKTKMELHHRAVHKISFVCPICGVVFKGPGNFKKHQKMHSGIFEPKAQCDVCFVWFKNSQNLKAHKKNLHNPEFVQYNCSHCNKECGTKSALYNHIKYVHTEPAHECIFCNKKCVNAIRLKEHMATHTGEALYTCPFCPKTFNSSANYYSHQKKTHPKEYEEKQAMKLQN